MRNFWTKKHQNSLGSWALSGLTEGVSALPTSPNPCSPQEGWGSLMSSKVGSGQMPLFFTARPYATAVLGVIILSVRLSHACIVTKLNDALQIFLYHTKGQSLCYFDNKSGCWATPPSLWNPRSKWPTPLRKMPTSTDFRSCLLYTSDAADE